MKIKKFISKILVIVICGWTSFGFSNSNEYEELNRAWNKFAKLNKLNPEYFEKNSKWVIAMGQVDGGGFKSLLTSVIPAIILINECYKNRKGYATVYINDVEFLRYQEKQQRMFDNAFEDQWRKGISAADLKGGDEFLEVFMSVSEMKEGAKKLSRTLKDRAERNNRSFLKVFYPGMYYSSNWNPTFRDYCQFTLHMFMNEATTMYDAIGDIYYPHPEEPR